MKEVLIEGMLAQENQISALIESARDQEGSDRAYFVYSIKNNARKLRETIEFNEKKYLAIEKMLHLFRARFGESFKLSQVVEDTGVDDELEKIERDPIVRRKANRGLISLLMEKTAKNYTLSLSKETRTKLVEELGIDLGPGGYDEEFMLLLGAAKEQLSGYVQEHGQGYGQAEEEVDSDWDHADAMLVLELQILLQDYLFGS